MKVEKIEFEELFPTGVYANQRYRAIGTLEDGDDFTTCFKELKGKIEKTFETLNPQINWLSDSTTYESSQKVNSVINKEKERIEIAIDNCTLSSELELLQQDAIKHGLVKQYLDKKKEFQR